MKEPKVKELKEKISDVVVTNELVRDEGSKDAIDVRYIEDSPCELEDVVETKEFEINGKIYLKCTEDGAIYDRETETFIGMYDEETKTILSA